MTLEGLSDGVAAARQHFEEGLIRAGFTETSGSWTGIIDYSAGAIELSITLPPRFPFVPARVAPVDLDEVPWSWHRERDGALCLVAEDDHDNLWWCEATTFLEHAKSWLDRSADNWVGDRPDLDLDRYFEPSPSDKRLYLFGDLASVTNRPVRFEPASNDAMRLAGPGVKPLNSRGASKRVYGFVTDVGIMAEPPRHWPDISSPIDPSLKLDALIRSHSVNVVVVKYMRDSQQGVIILEVWPNTAGGISAFRLLAGAETEVARAARSGPKAPLVKGKTVAIVGAGAIGSFVADGLARDGVDSITLIDGDRLLPGNLVRHLVGAEGVGLFKTTAIKRNLEHRFPGVVTVNAIEGHLTAANEAVELLQRFDLVINATADFSVTALLGAAAKSAGKTFLSVAIQNEGHTFRIDVMPPLGTSGALPSTSRVQSNPVPLHFDSGCGSPISPTQPSAVIEAGNAAARHAIGLLLERPISEAGEVRELDRSLDSAEQGE